MVLKTACVLLVLFVWIGSVKCIEDNVTTTVPDEAGDSNSNETEVIPKQTYKEAEKEITDYINSMLRSILPRVVGGSEAASLTPRCTAAMMKIFGNVRRLKGWTLKMLDSMGKPTAGILKGSSYSMGNYDECLDIAVTNKGYFTMKPEEEMFRGKYCKVRIRFPEAVIEKSKEYQKGLVNATDLGKLQDMIRVIPYVPVSSEYMNHFIGLCFPSTCTLEDVEQLVQVVTFPGSASVDHCETKSDAEVNYTQMIIMCFFLTLLCLNCVSTFIDWLLHSSSGNNTYQAKDKRCVSVTVAFSFCNNTKKLMRHIEDDMDGLLSGQAVRGITVASVAWVVLGYTYLFPYDAFYSQASSLENLRNYMAEEYFTYIVGFPLAIDSLFVCYGFLLTYSLWSSATKGESVSVNVFRLIIKHYLRLCIPLLMCLGVIILLPLISAGPFWKDIMDNSVTRCETSLGAHFGMYSNFLDISEQCFPHLWFVSCLAQLTLVAIFLCWILSKCIKFGVLLTIGGIIACNVAVGIITSYNEFPLSYVSYFSEKQSSLFWQINYSLPISHFGSYALGMLAGIVVAQRIRREIRPCLSSILWILCIGLIYGVIVILYNYRDGSLDSYWTAVYAACHRTVFAACVAWILVACAFGRGGFVNAIFSWKIFDPLFKLSFYAYLLHVVLIAFTVGIAKEKFHYSHWELILRAGSYIMVTYVIAYILFMMLEMPLKSFLSILFPRKTLEISVAPLNNFNIEKGNPLAEYAIRGNCKLWSVSETTNHTAY